MVGKNQNKKNRAIELSKSEADLNNTINLIINIYGIFRLTIAKYTLFSNSYQDKIHLK